MANEKIYGCLVVDGHTYRVKRTHRRYTDKNTLTKAYAYEVSKIEVLTGKLNNTIDSTIPKASTCISILLKGVKDVNENLVLDNHYKVLDENVEPLVVWHGTNENLMNLIEPKAEAIWILKVIFSVLGKLTLLDMVLILKHTSLSFIMVWN